MVGGKLRTGSSSLKSTGRVLLHKAITCQPLKSLEFFATKYHKTALPYLHSFNFTFHIYCSQPCIQFPDTETWKEQLQEDTGALSSGFNLRSSDR